MSRGIYLDENRGAPRLAAGLHAAGILAVRAVDVGMAGRLDPEHLAFAVERELALYTENAKDFMPLHWTWLGEQRTHAGIIILSPDFGLGEQVRRTTRLWRQLESGLENRLEFLRDWPAPRP
ncbi:MAG: DUF5615 family PIN-like protein [Dehalococcoidia bacterium]